MDLKYMGSKIRSSRVQLNLSEEEFAKIVGISLRALQSYERGERNPRDQVKIRIAAILNKNVTEIFFGDQLHHK